LYSSCPCDQIKKNLIGGVFDTHGKEERCVQGFGGMTLEGLSLGLDWINI